jgi:c-di-GMP-related signal transduction protein
MNPTPGAVAHVDYAFIARQPILDRQQKIIAYELFSRANESVDYAASDITASADSKMLFHALSNFGTEALFGDKSAFVNVVVESLTNEHFELVHSDRVVIEVPRVHNDDPESIARTQEKLSELRKRGYRLAVGEYVLLPAYVNWLPLSSYIKINTQVVPADTLQAIVDRISKTSAKAIAERIETAEQFRLCHQMGFFGFQGFFFAKPVTVSAKVINPAYTNVLELINLARQEAEVDKIEKVLKRDAALSFKLLRYINSSGFGLMCEITSFRHAVMILGYRKLLRWLTLLFATVNQSSSGIALARTAVTRGRMMELLAERHLSREDTDYAFVVGIFSLLDVMLGVRMEDALTSITLPEVVNEALLQRQGMFGPFLQLVEACEKFDFSTLEMLAMSLQFGPKEVDEAHIEALAWTEALGI